MLHIVLIAQGPDRLSEYTRLLARFDVRLIEPDFPPPLIHESGQTLVEQAVRQARLASRLRCLPALAEFCRLEVPALDSQDLGVDAGLSARVGGALPPALARLRHEERGARLHCVIALARHARDPMPLVCQASWTGRIALQPAGRRGDAAERLFYLPAQGCTAAQLGDEQYQWLSHRGQAMRQMQQLWQWQDFGQDRHSALP